jgi:hypothetical protein
MSDRNEIYIVQWEYAVVPYSADRLLSMIRRNPSIFQTIDTVEKWVWNDEACDWEKDDQ